MDVEERKPAKKNQNKLPRKSLENCSSKLDVRELSSSGHTVFCVCKPVALSVAVRARIRVTHYGALEQPSQRKAGAG